MAPQSPNSHHISVVGFRAGRRAICVCVRAAHWVFLSLNLNSWEWGRRRRRRLHLWIWSMRCGGPIQLPNAGQRNWCSVLSPLPVALYVCLVHFVHRTAARFSYSHLFSISADLFFHFMYFHSLYFSRLSVCVRSWITNKNNFNIDRHWDWLNGKLIWMGHFAFSE